MAAVATLATGDPGATAEWTPGGSAAVGGLEALAGLGSDGPWPCDAGQCRVIQWDVYGIFVVI